jgi:hypothetical protein
LGDTLSLLLRFGLLFSLNLGDDRFNLAQFKVLRVSFALKCLWDGSL